MPFLSARRTPFVVDELVLELAKTAEVGAIADVVLLEPASGWCSRTFPTSYQKIRSVQGFFEVEAGA